VCCSSAGETAVPKKWMVPEPADDYEEAARIQPDTETLDECDFSIGERGKYTERYAA
jgi:hypothetical protein